MFTLKKEVRLQCEVTNQYATEHMHVLYFVLQVLSIFLKKDRVSELTTSPSGEFGHFSLEFV